MGETDRIARLLEEVITGSPYYGPSTLVALQGIDAEMARQKPAWSAHCIWDLVDHMRAELSYALAVLENRAEPWAAGQTTWPIRADFSEAAWQQSIGDLKRAKQLLVQAIRRLDDSILDQRPHRVRGPYYRMLHGTLQHAIYHTGQISLLTGQFKET